MRNPWLDIPLADYEAHMALPTIGQDRLIADELSALIRAHAPSSVAILGCAGGNGFNRLEDAGIGRVVGVDINPRYIEETRQRYEGRIPGLELRVADIQTSMSLFEPVDLIYAALVLEYVDVARTMVALRRHCKPNGVLAVVSQAPHPTMARISSSQYSTLRLLEPIMRLVSQEELQKQATETGFTPHAARTISSVAGKAFQVQEFRLQ